MVRIASAAIVAVTFLNCGAAPPVREVEARAKRRDVVDAAIPTPAVETRAEVPDAGAGESNFATPAECWRVGMPIVNREEQVPSPPVPVSNQKYPLLFPRIGTDEVNRRSELLRARYRGFDFKVDEFGFVSLITATWMPCEVWYELAGTSRTVEKTRALLNRFLHELSEQMPEFQALDRLVLGWTPSHTSPTLTLSGQVSRYEPILPSGLDDATMSRSWSGMRVQWWKVENRDCMNRVADVGNHPLPCDQSRPPRRTLLVERPIKANYIEHIFRNEITQVLPKGLEMRRVAFIQGVNDAAFGRDAFGRTYDAKAAESHQINTVGDYDVDAITGKRFR